MSKLIGMCGLKGSGKNSVADIIVKNYEGWETLSFAKSLKDAVSVLFGLDREMLEGITPEAREEREKPVPFWCEKFGSDDVTPRKILQVFGTDLIRNHFYQDFWVYRMELELKQKMSEGTNIIITDCRFPNECEMIKALGGQIWQVHCGELPLWFTSYRDMGKIPDDIHESEWKWAKFQPDAIIHPNEKGLELLEKLTIQTYTKQFNI